MEDDPVARLIEATARADRGAFRALYAASSAKLMGVLLRILADRAEAEDALQEVYTRVWLKASRFDATRGRGMTWLIALTRNLAIDRLRQRPEAPHEAEDALAEVSDPAPRAEARLIAGGEARRIQDCLDQLPPDRATALRGAYLSGRSYADLAQAAGVPLNTMRTWLRRSLLALKECMGS